MVAPEGRRLLRIEARNAETPIERKPPWIKVKAKMGPEFTAAAGLVQREGLHTVCQEAGCPNIYECWEDREATFLIGGDQCTRRCDFCQIDTGKPAEFDADEPRRVAESVATMGLRYATVTGVARDDLPDGGAWLYAETVRQIHALLPGCGVELLIPDFNADPEQLAEVFGARARGARAQRRDRAADLQADPARRSATSARWTCITQARAAGLVTKSNLILGHGRGARRGLPGAARPARGRLRAAHHHPVPAADPAPPPGRRAGSSRRSSSSCSEEAEEIGFAGVMTGPLVRSSYRAGRLYQQALDARKLATA